MKPLLLSLFIVLAYAEFDPFYYGENSLKSEELNLYGLMNASANFNGKWHKINAIIEMQGTSFKILKIQNSCVVIEEISTQTQSKICLQKPKLLRN